MTLQEVIDGVVQEWWGVPSGSVGVKSGVSGLANSLESAVRGWMDERDCRMDQIVALAKAQLFPMIRMGTCGSCPAERWNLQLSPEAGHFIDFKGATLEDVLQEACDKYLPQEATT